MKALVVQVRRGIDSIANGVAAFDIRDLAAYMTIAALLFMVHSTFPLVAVGVAATLVICFERVRRGPWIWFAIAAAWTPALILNWQHQEDHTYLAAYWCLALGLAFVGERPRAVLAVNSRVLIGLVFTFAVMWKIITPAFVDGSLFHYKLLLDYRFRDAMTMPVGGLSDEESQANITSIIALQEPASERTSVALRYPASVSWLAHAMSWWTIAAEGGLAAMFLLPSRWLRRFRNAALCLFMLSTYTIVPVLGFGMLFTSLGLAQTRPREKYARLAYLATAFVVTVWFYR